MFPLKLTTWNAEWLELAAGVAGGWYEPETRVGVKKTPTVDEAQKKIAGFAKLVKEIDPDILFLCEAIVGADRMSDFTATHLPGYRVVTFLDGPDQKYENAELQWLWFLVKEPVAAALQAELLDPVTWKAYVEEESNGDQKGGSWRVALPAFDKTTSKTQLLRKTYRHTRHPMVLVLKHQGERIEIIGLHLKSKFTGSSPRKRKPNETFETYAKDPKVARFLADAHAARAKLTTQAANVRYYIDKRYRQEADPAIFVVGDLNDGPGKELMEREYLLHDLVGSLQGDVFFARKFLNHALFDADETTRWTVHFKDALDPDRSPNILLDHILFTQSVTSAGSSKLRVASKAGKVEHEIYDRLTSLQPNGVGISDHRPVSVQISLRLNA